MIKILMVLALVGTCHAGPIKVLGLNGDSKIVVSEMTAEQYTEILVATQTALDAQVVRGLVNYQDKGTSWQLEKFSVGLGVSGEIGLGPYKIGKSLKQRFVYSR